MNNDLHNNLKLTRVISPISQAGNTAMVGAIIDRQGYGSLEFAITLGTITTAGTAYTALLEDADELAFNVTNAAVADAYLLGTEALASFVDSEVNTTKKLGYIGSKRYVRLTMTPAGNTGASTMSAVAVQGSPSISPV
jgi:hypothetical protein